MSLIAKSGNVPNFQRMPQAPVKRGTILYVEDDVALSSTIRALLELEGYEASTAADGHEALGLVTRKGLRPEALIIDFNLPGGMDGTEAAEAVCHALGGAVPVIILSAELSNAQIPWLPGMPVLPIAKPVEPEVLLKAVEIFVAFHRFVQERRRGRRPSSP
jgi:two-component system CheB/CheR fusion protein